MQIMMVTDTHVIQLTGIDYGLAKLASVFSNFILCKHYGVVKELEWSVKIVEWWLENKYQLWLCITFRLYNCT